jgi:polyhydroxyalkanoate synthesis regulator phasin
MKTQKNNMTQEQIKNVESVVKLALEIYADKQEQWDTNIETITKEAFAELRIKPVHQTTLQRKDCEIDRFKEGLRQHENAIDNLRGYITFLESKISKLENELDEHESY